MDGKKTSHLVHRLVADTFLGESDLQVNHIDGNKENNSVTNLERVTAALNIKHARQTGLHMFKSLQDDQISYIRNNYTPRHKEFGQKALAEKFNVSQSVISRIINFNTHKEVI